MSWSNFVFLGWLFDKPLLHVSAQVGNTHFQRQAMADVQITKKQDGWCATKCTICLSGAPCFLSASSADARGRSRNGKVESWVPLLCVTLLHAVTSVSQTGSRCTVTVHLVEVLPRPLPPPAGGLVGRCEFASSFTDCEHSLTPGPQMNEWMIVCGCASAPLASLQPGLTLLTWNRSPKLTGGLNHKTMFSAWVGKY